MFPLLVADIGGTNARYGLVTGKDVKSGEYLFASRKEYSCADFDSLASSLDTYISSLDTAPQHACIAIAGPIDGDVVQMTNLNWRFSISETRQQFGFQQFEVINDFSAKAFSLPHMQPQDLVIIKEGISAPLAAKAIIGPGTGLGMASLIHTPDGWYPVAGEGGHATFAPASEKEIEILKVVGRDGQHVSKETFLCGRGLVTLYQALSVINGVPAQAYESSKIVELAESGDDPLCKEALSLFCAILGSAAGNLALTTGAKGGLFLAGGILPRIQQFLSNSLFVESFIAKGVMSGFVKDIPVYLITHKHPALIGAAAWLESRVNK